MTNPFLTPAPTNAFSIDQNDAARLTGLSAKTLGRMADAGEPVGRLKVGRRVLYHRPTLEAWLLSWAPARPNRQRVEHIACRTPAGRPREGRPATVTVGCHAEHIHHEQSA